jgi:hypothetical protein
MAATALRRCLRGLLARCLPCPQPPSFDGHWDGARVLTEEECSRFQQDGVLVFDPQAPEAELDGVIERLQGQYQGAKRLLDAWQFSEGVQVLATLPRVLGALWQLYGRQPLPFQTLNFPVGTEQPVHSDTIHFNSMPAGYMCGVWIALEDVDDENGPLVYYPGSHKLPEYTLADVGCAPDVAHYPSYERFIGEMIAGRRLQPRTATIRKGQALVWAANLLHGGSPRRDGFRSRHSQATHYFFSGCRYYTPMWSRHGRICWRRPRWIPPRRVTSESLSPA